MDPIHYQPIVNKPREIHPSGAFAATCVDIIDLGMRVKDFKGVKSAAHTIALVFSTGKTSSEGFALDVSQEFTMSLSDKSKLKPFLEGWRGKAFTAEEKGSSFDIVKDYGNRHAFINIVHKQSVDGQKTYANIGAAMPLPEGMPAPKVNYKRAPFWATRKAEYAREFEAYMRATPDEPEEMPSTEPPF